MSVSVTWHGHATLSLDVNGSKIVVDPFFSGNPATTTKADEVAADFILITHGHGDHVGDAVSIAKRTGALVIANFEICNWFNAQGHAKTHAQHIGGSFQHPFGRVKLTQAFHGSGLPDGSYGGMPAGFLLTVDGKNVYIAGDTALFSDMQLYGRAGLELAIIPIGDNYTMGPDDALTAVTFLKPKVVIPIHYNTWPPISQDVDAWIGRVKAETESRPVKLGVGETYRV
ncbi:MAG: metal-dependent hydrolase [Chloroflexi bacterium]|nr:metal-dependent hydrolase [Chloroflexota bacterium]MCI0649396.1 metal-dependent hydrolase [Chloroflexota bacterium]MCI0727077.1 metal-dependent hydrolase [Chloroflexota bacterium]